MRGFEFFKKDKVIRDDANRSKEQVPEQIKIVERDEQDPGEIQPEWREEEEEGIFVCPERWMPRVQHPYQEQAEPC